MFKKIIIGLCFIPVFAQAELVCLEGPHDNKCHAVNPNKEIFNTRSTYKYTEPKKPTNAVRNNAVASAPKSNKRIIKSGRIYQTLQPNKGQQRILNRARTIESRAEYITQRSENIR